MGKPRVEKFKKDLQDFKHIGIDSMCFLYQFADHPQYSPLTNALFTLLENKKIQAVTSLISVIEVFIKPEEAQDQQTIAEYENVFRNLPNLEITPIDWYLARLSSKIRANYKSIKTPDAIQVAATLLKNFPVFLTNDKKISKIEEIRVTLLSEYL